MTSTKKILGYFRGVFITFNLIFIYNNFLNIYLKLINLKKINMG
jgi:hypothetical protein